MVNETDSRIQGVRRALSGELRERQQNEERLEAHVASLQDHIKEKDTTIAKLTETEELLRLSQRMAIDDWVTAMERGDSKQEQLMTQKLQYAELRGRLRQLRQDLIHRDARIEQLEQRRHGKSLENDALDARLRHVKSGLDPEAAESALTPEVCQGRV